MNQPLSKPTFEENIRQVMQTLPPIIRNYLVQGKYTEVAKNMMAKYGLRIDQGGVLEREIMLLLMGIESPDEFVQALTEEARLDQKTIGSIVQDVNAQIFVPLREEEARGGAGKMPSTSGPATSPRAATPASASQMQTGSSSGGTQPTSHFHLQNKIAPPMRAAASSPATATPAPSTANMPSNKMLEDHEEPHIEFSKAPASSPAPVRAPIAPQMPPRPAGIPNAGPASAFAKGSEPPANLPGAMPSGVIPPGGRPSFMIPPKIQPPASGLPKQAPLIVPQGSAAPRTFERAPAPSVAPTTPFPAAPKTPLPPPKSYTVDPYREPIE